MMMPSITAIPNNAMNPIAAHTRNGMPEINSPSTPPKIAIGITLMASSVSTIEPKLNHSSTAINARLIGTTIDSRLMASCRLPNSPTHSTRDPGGSCTWVATLSCALLFPIDIGGTRDQVDRRHFAQGDLRDGAVRAGRADPQILDRLGALAILR